MKLVDQAKGQTPAHPHPKHEREQTGHFSMQGKGDFPLEIEDYPVQS